VVVVVDPEDYPTILEALRQEGGHVSRQMALGLARKAFERTCQYDRAIAEYLASRS
jgi:phosphoribosylaminoimidazolecarboxamide formyltransferase/IMP cyclohydrolase